MGKFRNYHQPHQILGSIIVLCLILQIGMGYLHQNYARLQRRTSILHAHIWAGRLILALGIVNTRL